MIGRIYDFMGYRLLNIGNVFIRESNRIRGHQQHPPDSWNKYIKDDPYEMLRVTYPLGETSVVVDLGGYKGEWAQRIYSRYKCQIDIYEPHPIYSKIADLAFEHNTNVTVFPYALSTRNGVVKLSDDTIYSSLFHHKNVHTHTVEMADIASVFEMRYSRCVDLLKINIEGSEYEILPELLAHYDIKKIRFIQIQFHNTVPDYASRRDAIRKELSKTHKCDWCYEYLYESWSLKE
jgi:FkbM family methyltransferase